MTEKTTRLAVVHTVGTLLPLFKQKLAEAYPGADAFHMLDESLLQDLIRHGQTPGLVARVTAHAQLAEKAGATVILFTCSSTSPAIDTARKTVGIPIVKIDDAMAREAAARGNRIGLLCTTPSTVEPSSGLIRTHAQDLGRTVEIVTALEQDAYHALMRGERDEHDRIASNAARRMMETCDVIVLAQASLAHLAERLQQETPVPVLSSPDLCIKSLGQYL
ncbi:aspartate/glutamate racemase family protein [Chelativorans sp.]|uniref:aspartate/glutamate racemase family protein n=1 Tax=Chelativorans sp. TaxID=2203393 RepID=UPI0028120E37|nr:aspartate/glutamate racemase family protein [Chelativorans sp.]